VFSGHSSSKTARKNNMKEQNQNEGIIKSLSEMPTCEASISSPISNCQPKSNIKTALASSSKEFDQPSSGMFVHFHAEQPMDKNIEQQFSTELYAGIHQVRPIRVSPPKPGKLYPCLSDIDSVTENESESDEPQQENTPQSIEYV
jgi:hypothetical protein